MRLDSYLVNHGDVGSRGRAKKAITEGHIMVNGKVITKPAHDIAYSDTIEITDGIDKPAGYWKLKEIQEKTQIMKKGDNVLDVGSSAGGFLMFASEIAAHVDGIEFSREFHTQLLNIQQEYSNVSVEFTDVFELHVSKSIYDVLLLDITVSPESSMKALKNIVPGLKSGGMLLHVLKSTVPGDKQHLLSEYVSLGLEILNILEPEKKEVYLIARKL